jgi:hypothetical protein
VRSATLRRQAVSLLNDISTGFGPMSMGADSAVWRRAVRSPRYLRNFVCPKIVMTTMSLRLSAGARSEEVFATHSREPFAVAGAMAWRESVIVRLD